MLDLNDFITFSDGVVEIGVDPQTVESIFSSLDDSNIKKEYLTASTPRKTVHYDQFSIQKKLITVKKFREFIYQTGYITDSEKEGWGWVWNDKWIKKKNVSWKNPFLNDTDVYYNETADLFPVMQVSWNDAVEYTKWLSNLSGENIRLPFEYEWEIFGNFAGLGSIADKKDINKERIKTDFDFIIKLKDKIRESEFQLGLLWEWTFDWYIGYDENIINRDFGNIYKILRGGSLLSESIQKSKEFRFRRCPTARSPYYGFRVVFY